MGTNVTLKSIFAASKDNLSDKLRGLSLPKDSQQVQSIVSEYLNNLFENNGSFRQSLTESEDYLIQASLRLLHAQQNIAIEFAKSSKSAVTFPNGDIKQQKTNSSAIYYSIAGAGIGALVGSFVGTWGAVAGAVTLTALSIYCSTNPKITKGHNEEGEKTITKIENNLNPEVFCDIVEKVCESIDNVIDTYRVQVKRIVNTYEQREQPSLLNTYSSLVEQIANVIQISKTCNEDIPSKLKNAISIMEESLENYDLKFDNGKIINA